MPCVSCCWKSNGDTLRRHGDAPERNGAPPPAGDEPLGGPRDFRGIIEHVAKRSGSPQKVFFFTACEYRPARWLHVDTAYVAAPSLGEAKAVLADAGLRSERFRSVPDRGTEGPVSLAVDTPGVPVWQVGEDDSGGWIVGGREAIESYIRRKYGDGPYPMTLTVS